jgi:hypothetical protein
MNYTTKQVGKPTAHVTKKKSRLKVYNGHVVFLNDKDNFEFEIHNPTQKSVLCKIKLNGEHISTGGVVIKPGQRVFLERFLDTNNKFEFSTYEVKDTSANRTAIDLNGDVRIEFYNEQTYQPNYGTTLNSAPMAYYSNTLSVSNTIETGRVKKGEESKQQFTNSYQNFEYFASRQIIFKILPLGIKNKTTDEIKQYCTECGVKMKPNFKFCPSCGNKL